MTTNDAHAAIERRDRRLVHGAYTILTILLVVCIVISLVYRQWPPIIISTLLFINWGYLIEVYRNYLRSNIQREQGLGYYLSRVLLSLATISPVVLLAPKVHLNSYVVGFLLGCIVSTTVIMAALCANKLLRS